MIKKLGVLSLLLALLLPTLSSCGAPMGKETITVWAAENVLTFTRERCQVFLEENPDVAEQFQINVVAMSEGDTASQMQTDVDAGADVYAFAQDQLGRLIRAGALSPLGGTFLDAVKAENDPGSVAAASMGDRVYAYPLTADNGYMLYYDTSVVTDPTSLRAILADCAAAGKKMYMDIRNGWYLVSFFFGAGCHYTTEVNEDGNIVSVDCDFNSEKGLKALMAAEMLTAGTHTTTSHHLALGRIAFSSSANFLVSVAVLFIFQLPAMMVLRYLRFIVICSSS